VARLPVRDISAEVPLLTNGICLGEPGTQGVIDVIDRGQPEGVQVISRRERLDGTESRVLQPTREHDMAVEPPPPGRQLGERHANLKCDSRLLRQDRHRANRLRHHKHRLEQVAHAGRLVREVMLEVVSAAGVRLVAIREVAAALAAFPQRPGCHDVLTMTLS
jgi:hypothetical protein